MTFTLDKYMPYTVGFDRFFDTLDIVSNTDAPLNVSRNDLPKELLRMVLS